MKAARAIGAAFRSGHADLQALPPVAENAPVNASLRVVADELAKAGHLNSNGRAFSASSVKSMLGSGKSGAYILCELAKEDFDSPTYPWNVGRSLVCHR